MDKFRVQSLRFEGEGLKESKFVSAVPQRLAESGQAAFPVDAARPLAEASELQQSPDH